MWRSYQACQMYHCSPTELDEVPARIIDWHLAIHNMVEEIADEQR